jgi:hypothetical protein
MTHKLAYNQLRQILEGLGYQSQTAKVVRNGQAIKSIVFRRGESEMYIILPFMRPGQAVHSAHLSRVKAVLEDEGIWNKLVKQTKTDRADEAARVLQSLASIKACN